MHFVYELDYSRTLRHGGYDVGSPGQVFRTKISTSRLPRRPRNPGLVGHVGAESRPVAYFAGSDPFERL